MKKKKETQKINKQLWETERTVENHANSFTLYLVQTARDLLKNQAEAEKLSRTHLKGRGGTLRRE